MTMEAHRGNDTTLKIGCWVECGGIPHTNWFNNSSLHHADKLLNNRKIRMLPKPFISAGYVNLLRTFFGFWVGFWGSDRGN
jgi:hypothetical protein